MTAATSTAASHALAAARPAVFWTDRADAPPERSPLKGVTEADLVVIGGGFSGLWTAMHATEDAGRRVVVLEAERVGHGASSRNGGFCDPSLTHGIHNGASHWEDELATLVRLGRQNHAELLAAVRDEGVEAGVEVVPELLVATEPWQLDDLAEGIDLHRRHGDDVELLDRSGTRARLDSPTYLGGSVHRSIALVDPARLAWGLADVVERRGATVHDRSAVRSVEEDGAKLVVRTDGGEVRADRVVMATNAYAGPVRRPRRYVVPVYDYVLVTEPLTSSQRASLGWAERDGAADAGNQFHYYRLTADDRILWGGYDAVYHWGSRIDASLEQREQTHRLLAEHFLETFPQLAGLRFTHRWGGVIDTCTRFSAFFGTAVSGRVGYALGYTGLGVAASRFGAQVVLDLLDGADTERTRLRMVRERPLPFPPEPLRSAGINLTRWSLDRADRRGGQRNLWLRGLDAAGLGFDS